MRNLVAENWDWRILPSAYDHFEALRARFAKPLGCAWLAAACLTWVVCPMPAQAPANSAKLEYANAAGYFVECLSLWPAIAYLTARQGPHN
jgi:hypothetical protein